jgi:hypothetical protein
MVDSDQFVEPSLDQLAPAPYRPPGLLIAILTTGLLYGVGPLVPVVLTLLANAQGGAVNTELSNIITWLNVVTGIITLVVCVLAWRGHPRWIRWALIGIVWIASIVQFIAFLRPADSGVNLYTGSIFICQLMLYLLVPAYLTWYLNRAPARTFYRAQG